MKLSTYRQKRDLSKTNEPVGDEAGLAAGRGGSTFKGAFVVHQHDATNMHFDLRLEVGGVLSSFACPKGISLDPDEKLLAINTEDHPIEYLDFEAVIPEGTYGAGPMIAWDSGLVRYLDMSAEEGLRTGKLHIQLEGKKLAGRFGLVRLKPRWPGARPDRPMGSGKEWLLFKKQDAFAAKGRSLMTELPRSVLSGLTVTELLESAELSRSLVADAAKVGAKASKLDGRTLSPMLCTLAEIPTGPGYLYELKLDGVRIVATKDERGVDLRYRSGRSAVNAYPEVVRALAALPVERVVLDGEIIAFDERGRPDFERLSRRIQGDRKVDLREALVEVPVYFMVFDMLRVGDVELVKVPLVKRKALLAKLVRGQGIVRVLDHLEEGGEALFDFCRQNGLEGVVSKRADAIYTPGPSRTRDWIKTKCEREATFVVIGHTRGENSRHRLGALDLGSYEGDVLKVRGRVGSGLTDEIIDDLLARLDTIVSKKPVAEGTYEHAPRGRTHVLPEIVVRVRYLEWSDDGNLRFPVFLGLEHDADPKSCTTGPHEVDAALTKGPASTASPAAAPIPETIEVRVTNRQKIFWPEEGYTKGELVDYYDAISPVLLPILKDRPVMLVRYPDGIAGKNFYQWNVPHGCPPWVKSVVLGKHVRSPEGDDAHKKNVFLIDRKEALLYVANLACIPIHILGSRVGSSESADFLTIDFDVNLSSLREAITLAETLKEILDDVGLVGFPKTSGQSGLHVFVPLGAGVSPEASRMMADLLGRLIVERHPTTATMERSVPRRGQRVYVDTGQTGPSRTIVAPYSVRATKGGRVSAPLRWSEVTRELDPGAFTIKTMLDRVEKVGDPMAKLLATPVDLAAVMGKLAERMPPPSKR
ncbi:MAG: DNA ligase D [Polyangiaceae bacterium]